LSGLVAITGSAWSRAAATAAEAAIRAAGLSSGLREEETAAQGVATATAMAAAKVAKRFISHDSVRPLNDIAGHEFRNPVLPE
jgi:hypothetical protein